MTNSYPNQIGGLAQAVQAGVGTQIGSRPPTQVEEHLAGSHALASDLNMVVETIERRLASVIQPRLNAGPDKSPSVPREMLVPLADQIRAANDSISASINRLRELNSQIQLPE